MNASDPTVRRFRRISEEAGATPGFPSLVHPGWRDAFPWLVQGTTARGGPEASFDLGLFSDASTAAVVSAHWERLLAGVGASSVAHARQVHESTVRYHDAMPGGFHLAPPCDGHATAQPGLLLAVSTADCIPVFLVDPERRAVALVHAGWRGAAAGVLEAGIAVLERREGSRPADLHAHLGPAICGDCYEVGPEVFEALNLPVPERPEPLDLRSALADRAVEAGVPDDQITISAHCTLCGDAGLFSHRGGDRGRQVGYLGVRP